MTQQRYGTHSTVEAWEQETGKIRQAPLRNNLTRRNVTILERMPNRSLSTSLASANIKALRLFRYICRMLPFIVRTHEVDYRFNVLHAKRYIANHFREHSKMTNLIAIDRKIQEGYEHIHEAEWHFVNTGYLYQFLAGPKKVLRDQGINRFEEMRGTVNKKQAPSGFLQRFYHGNKSHDE